MREQTKTFAVSVLLAAAIAVMIFNSRNPLDTAEKLGLWLVWVAWFLASFTVALDLALKAVSPNVARLQAEIRTARVRSVIEATPKQEKEIRAALRERFAHGPRPVGRFDRGPRSSG